MKGATQIITPPFRGVTLLIILLFTIIGQAYFLFQASERNKSVNNALEHLEENIHQERENYRHKFNSLQEQVEIAHREQKDLERKISTCRK